MTTTNRPVTRVTPDSYRVLYQSPRPIVVTIERGTLAFREKGRRQVYRLPIDNVFRSAVRTSAAQVKKRKANNEPLS
jgi:hypothetical protein